jgi:hypothetical protein
MAIGMLTHNGEIRHSGFEGEPVETARGLLVMVACALHYLRNSGPHTPAKILPPLRNWRKASHSVRYKKGTMQTRFCPVLCDTVSGKDALFSSGSLILPLEGMTLFLMLSPIADDAIRTSLPKEIRLALRSHKALFY